MEPSYEFDFDYEIQPMFCFCVGMCPEDSDNATCKTKPGGKCFAAIELVSDDDGSTVPLFTYGCLPPNEMALLQCRANEMEKNENRSIKCCDAFDYCNKHLLATVKHTQLGSADVSTEKVLMASIIISIAIVLVGVPIIYFKYKWDVRKKGQNKEDNIDDVLTENVELDSTHARVVDVCTEIQIKTNGTDSNSSNRSSSQMSVIGERTISNDICLEVVIGKGKNTEVWRGVWRQTRVAVKIYNKAGERCWLKETGIYQTLMVRHEHILGYIASDIKGDSRMFIVLEYHAQGSLREFLKNNTITPQELISILKGLASGLAHLHTEIIGSKNKPCIAHNNINSRNILVTAEKKCCFADFANAIKCKSNETVKSSQKEVLNSDVRYLAPEVLNCTFNDVKIESFMMSDVYSFSLVMWEILRRCKVSDTNVETAESRIPYDEELETEGLELTKENISEIVLTKNQRPRINTEWEQNHILVQVVKIMLECWCSMPAARLTCLRIKKSIFKILEQSKC